VHSLPEAVLSQFLTVGAAEERIAAIGPLLSGHGILGELVRHPEPLRPDELSELAVAAGVAIENARLYEGGTLPAAPAGGERGDHRQPVVREHRLVRGFTRGRCVAPITDATRNG
jgi:hypothetical protein